MSKHRRQREWKAIEASVVAHGGSLNWDDYIPRPVPDDQNFYAAPMMTAWFVKATNTISPAFPFASLLSDFERTNEWIDVTSASNFLARCSGFDSQFDQIRQALKRPAARMNGDYTKPFSPPICNFVSYRAVGRVLAYSAKSHLALGQPDRAVEDLAMLHDLNATLCRGGKPATLVEAMVHVAIAGIYAGAVDRGLAAHAWREPELAALQKQTADVHLLPCVVYSLQAERAGDCRLLDQLPKQISSFFRPNLANIWWLVYGRCVDENKKLIIALEEPVIASFDSAYGTVSPSKAKAAAMDQDKLDRQATRPWNALAQVCVPNLAKALRTAARNQTWVDHARIVCALERCRLRTGKYPAALQDLGPDFVGALPQDIITGKPLIYSRKDGQSFLLYSVGWNEVDDGGMIVRDSKGEEDPDRGDWVWHYPEP